MGIEGAVAVVIAAVVILLSLADTRLLIVSYCLLFPVGWGGFIRLIG